MRFSNVSSPHIATGEDVGTLMRRVLYALIPGALACMYFFGWGVLVNLVVAALAAVAAEGLMLSLRGRPVRVFLTDGSALVTAALLALALPTLAPWWLTAIGVAFAVIVAKHLYGGLGYNPFNPAMIGYVVVLISFPREMTQWVDPGRTLDLSFFETLRLQLTGQLPAGVTLDAITSATPLDSVKTQLGLNRTLSEIRSAPVFGQLGGVGWEWMGGGFLAGGLWLLANRTIRWQIPMAVLAALVLAAGLFHIVDSDVYPSPLFHLFSGGAILGAFFIATDPITASTTNKGCLIYGAGIGLLTYVIRTWGGYPDGVAFAVLLMNMAVPTIDHYTQPRVFGERDE